MQREFGPIANEEVDRLGREVSGAELKGMFWREYIERTAPWQLQGFETESRNGTVRCRARLLRDGKPVEIRRRRQRPAGRAGPRVQHRRACRASRSSNYSEHALSAGEEAAAIAYIQIKHADGRTPLGRRGGHQHRAGLRPRRPQRPEPLLNTEETRQLVLAVALQLLRCSQRPPAQPAPKPPPRPPATRRSQTGGHRHLPGRQVLQQLPLHRAAAEWGAARGLSPRAGAPPVGRAQHDPHRPEQLPRCSCARATTARPGARRPS